MPQYPTAAEIRAFATSLATADTAPFFDRVSPDVDWEVIGSTRVSGRYKSLDDWRTNALGVINRALDEPIRLTVRNITGGGDQEWAALELMADSVCKTGMKYSQRYVWMLHFDRHGIIDQGLRARAYLDTALVDKAIQGTP